MKLSCAIICRDCDDTLEACLQSVRPHVDELVIIDTGSRDNTPEIAKRYADKFEVFLGCNNLESGLIDDFAMARNRSMDLVTGDAVMWIDSDDILIGGEHIKKIFEQATQDNVVAMIPYDYSHDAQGRCTCVHWRERIVKPAHRFRWESPIHEVLVPIQPIEGTITTVRTDMVRVVHKHHLRTKPKEQGRNLRIIKQHLKKVGEGDIRMLYYAGLEYGYVGDFGRAITSLRRYVQLSQWYDEKCLAMLELSRLYSMIGDFETSVDWALHASTVRHWPEPYWRLGRTYYALARDEKDMEYNFRRAATFMSLGLSVGENDTVLFVDPFEKYRIHEFLNVCLSTLGDIDGAIASCEAGLVGLPDNEHLLNNLQIYRKNRDMKQVVTLLSKLDLADEQRQIVERALAGDYQVGSSTEPAPMPLASSPRAAEHRPPQPGKLDLVFLVGHQLEPWNPTTVANTGIGGSETMAMHMARLLAAKGHAVRLYGHCTTTMEGTFDGVEYLDASRYQGVECDVMIASRQPTAVDDNYNLKAKARVLWIHDVHCGEALNFSRDIRFDRILALSQWHKALLGRCYPTMNKDKIIVTRNGIDLSRFEGTEERDPHRAIYSSSPDRGLPALLDMWPEIRKRVPDATLHTYYGWANWEITARMQNDEAALRRIAHLKHMTQTMDGVIAHDRINQQELAREFMRSGVLAYCTWFSETSMIGAMEAQAAGCHIVTSNLAALRETVADRGVLLEWDRPWEEQNTEPTENYKQRFITAVVEAMLHPDESKREAVKCYARDHFSLDALATEWDVMLTELVAELAENVVPKFVDVSEVAA